MIHAVIFDCFGVLYVDPSQAFYQKHVPNYDQLLPQLNDLARQSDLGLVSLDEHDRQVAELTGLEYEFVHSGILSEHSRNEELLTYAQSLRPIYRVGMLSNISKGGMSTFFSTQEQQLFFDEVVLSGEVGMAKPDPEIFQEIALRLGVNADECIMIDDKQENCDGAARAGMKAILYTTTKQTISKVRALL